MSTFFSQAMIFVLIWFVILFTVLPWGVRVAEDLKPGHDPGAPARPDLRKKAIATTLISAAIWFLYYFVTEILGHSLLDLSRMGQ